MLAEAVSGAEAVVIAVPTSAFRELLEVLPEAGFTRPVIWACKGLEAGTGKFMHMIIDEVLGADRARAIVSGPTKR